jgi:hypothetical protein
VHVSDDKSGAAMASEIFIECTATFCTMLF